MARFQSKPWTNKQTGKPGLLDGLHRTVSANSSWLFCKPFHLKATSKWLTDALRTRRDKLINHPCLLVVDDSGYRPPIILKGVGSDISQFAFERPVDSLTPRWNISRYLATATRGLTKSSKNFQAPLRPVRHHIVSDPLEYWHLLPVFWSGHIILLTYGIMPYRPLRKIP